MATQKDVAEKANVSFITVSRVLNNKGNVKEETKKKVYDAIEELNYYPNSFAQGLIANKVNTLAVLPHLKTQIMMEETSYYRRLVAGIERYCLQNGYDILLSGSRGLGEKFDFFSPYYQRKADGIILLGVDIHSENYKKITEDKIPCSIIGERDPNSYANFIDSDNEFGTKMLTEYIIKMGHTKIAYLHVNDSVQDTTDRFNSFKKVLKENNIALPDEYIFLGDYVEESGRKAIRSIASMKNRPTALVSATDKMAIGVVEEAVKLGIKIPDDLSLAGFDGHEFTRVMTPTLATVVQDLEGMGYKAAELLVSQINGELQKENLTVFPVIFEANNSIKNLN